jgi:hypothetical protein
LVSKVYILHSMQIFCTEWDAQNLHLLKDCHTYIHTFLIASFTEINLVAVKMKCGWMDMT